MGIFDRIGNLVKGTIGVMKSDGPTAKERSVDALERELKRRGLDKKEPATAQAAKKQEDVLEKLKKLHENGLLTDEEYAEKVAAASGLMGPLPSSSEAASFEPEEAEEEHAVEPQEVELADGVKKTL